MVLLLPAWLPGKHAARGEVEKLTGLKIAANGKRVAWTRDTVDVWAFHVDVPRGAKQLDIEFQFTGATDPDQGRVSIAPAMLNLEFEQVSLYPAGWFTRRIPIQATVAPIRSVAVASTTRASTSRPASAIPCWRWPTAWSVSPA